MATIDELSTTQLEVLVATNINSVLNEVFVAINNAGPAQTDAIGEQRRAAVSGLQNLLTINDAVWNSGIAAADAILNPPGP